MCDSTIVRMVVFSHVNILKAGQVAFSTLSEAAFCGD